MRFLISGTTRLHTMLALAAVFVIATNPTHAQAPSFVRLQRVFYKGSEHYRIADLEDLNGQNWNVTREKSTNANRIKSSSRDELESNFTLSSSAGKIVLTPGETPLGFVENQLLTRAEIEKNEELHTELRAYKLMNHKFILTATTQLPGTEYQIQILSPKSKFFIVNDNLDGDGLSIKVFESNLALKTVITPFPDGNRTSEIHWKSGLLYVVSESHDTSGDSIKIDFYNDTDFELKKTVSLPRQANLSFSTLLESGLYIQTFFDRGEKSTFQGYFVKNNGAVVSIQKGLVLNHPIEFREANQTRLAGLYRYDLIVASADEGSLILRRKLLPPTNSKSERFARLGVYHNSDGSLTVLVGRRTSEADTELDAALLNYSSNSNAVKKFSLGRISRFSEVKNATNTLTISEPSKTTVYEKILHP